MSEYGSYVNPLRGPGADRGDKEVSLQVFGRSYSQPAFRYQAKCLRWLREKFATLPAEARDRVSAVLRETGGLEVLSG